MNSSATTSWISPDRKDQPITEQDRVIGLGYTPTNHLKSILINIRYINIILTL